MSDADISIAGGVQGDVLERLVTRGVGDMRSLISVLHALGVNPVTLPSNVVQGRDA